MRWIGIPSAAIAAALVLPAQADEPAGDLLLSTIGYGAPIPERSAFRLETAGNTELNQHVARLVADALRSLRYEIRYDAPFVVTVATETPWTEDSRHGSLGRIDVDSGLDLEFVVNLWSTTANSLLGGPRREPEVDRDYRILLSIYGTERPRYVWHGEAVDLREGHNPFAASTAMVSALIEAMGKTVPARMITLGAEDRSSQR